MRPAARALLICWLLPVLVSTSPAQTQSNTAQIGGTVNDPLGAGVPGARVSITNTETGAQRSAETSVNGQYVAVLIPSGRYQVSVDAPGFSRATKSDISVSVGAGVNVDFDLTIAPVFESTTVTADQVEVARADAGDTIASVPIRDLPINGRRFQDFVTLTPAAAVEARRGQISILGQRGINTSINVDGTDYNESFFGGMRATQTQVFSIPQDAVAEFQVITSAYSPEFGHSTGGIVTAITKNGTNSHHGDAFYLLRHKELGLKNALRQQSLETRQQFGGSVGGPIVHNRLFYFGAAEQQFARIPRVVLFPALNGVTRTAANAEAYDLYKGAEQAYVQTNNGIAAFGRLDYQFAAGHRLTVSQNHTRFEAANSITPGGNQIDPAVNSAQTANGNQSGPSETTIAQFIGIISPALANDFRFQYGREVRARSANFMGAGVTANIGAFGGGAYVPSDFVDQRYQIVDNLNWQHGAHVWKFGGEWNLVKTYQFFGFNQFGVVSVSGSDVNAQLAVMSAAAGNRFDATSVAYQRNIGNLLLDFKGMEPGAFVQDAWSVRKGLTVHYGMRWEGQFLPAPVANRADEVASIRQSAFPFGALDPAKKPDLAAQFMPRLGVAWSPGHGGRTVIRGSGGLFYARTPLVVAAAPYNNFRDPAGDLSVKLPFAVPVGNPNAGLNTVYKQLKLIGIDLNQYPLGSLPIVTVEQIQQIPRALGIPFVPFQGAAPLTWAPDFRNARALQWNAGVERQTTAGLSVYANLSYANTVHLTRNHDYNLPAPVIRPGDRSLRPFYGLRSGTPRPNPSFDQVKARESSARSLYRGATFGTRLRRARYQLEAHYTLSSVYSDDDNERDADISYNDAFSLRPEYSYSELDARHTFVAHGVVALPGGVTLSGIGRLRSGAPFTASTGSDSNEDLDQARPNPTDLPYAAPGVPFRRNSFRHPGTYSADLRLLKDWPVRNDRVRLQFSAEMYNVFNNSNVQVGTRNRVYGVGVDPATGNVVAPPASFGRVYLPSGAVDPNNTVGTPFQFQAGIRLFF